MNTLYKLNNLQTTNGPPHPQASIEIIWRSLGMFSKCLPWRAGLAGKACGFRNVGSHSLLSASPANSSSVAFSLKLETLEEVPRAGLNLKHSDEFGMSSVKCHGPGHPFLACAVAASALF